MFDYFRHNLDKMYQIKKSWVENQRLTMPSSCTHVRGISASMSMTFDMDAGMASYVGAGAAGAAEGAGRDAARAAAMDVAAILRSLENDERNVH